MCFSATASFALGTVLFAVGGVTLNKVLRPAQLGFAFIPFLFAIQQFAEGFVWLSLTSKTYASMGPPAITLYLIFAQVLWPVMVPLSIWLMEQQAKRRKVLLYVLTMGIMTGCYLSYCLFTYEYGAEIMSFHIHYLLNFPQPLSRFSGLFYIIPTVLPSFISGNPKVPILGICIMASYIFTKLFYENYFVSVWCFFAVALSAIILHIVVSSRHSTEQFPAGKLWMPADEKGI